MSHNEWIQLKKGDKITRDGKTVFEVEAVARAIGNHMAITAAGCLQTDYKEWEKVETN